MKLLFCLRFFASVLGTGLLFSGPALSQACPTADEVREKLQVTYVDGALLVGEVAPFDGAMMRLAAFAAAPHLVNEPRITSPVRHAQTLALDILRPQTEARAAFLPGGRFKGATPEERLTSEQVFLDACAPAMTALAPKPPFRLMIADTAVLGAYDEARGALTIPRGPNYAAPNYYSDFLTVKSTHEKVKTDRYWPMTRAEADALYARLEAAAASPGVARQVQAVAIVEVLEIDPKLRTASIKLIEFALFNNDFTEKLYGYDRAPPTDAPPPSKTPEQVTSPLPEGRFATQDEAVARASALCEGHSRTATNLRCACISEKVGLAWQKTPDKHIYTLLNETVNANQFDCRNPEAQYKAFFADCKKMFGRDELVIRVGEEKACTCIAERSMVVGMVSAYAFCKNLKDY